MERVRLLRAQIRAADEVYYGGKPAELADAEYDRMYRALLRAEAQYPALRDSTSPTTRVGRATRASASVRWIWVVEFGISRISSEANPSPRGEKGKP